MKTEIKNLDKREIEVRSPAELIASAVTSGADLEKLEKLLELQAKWDAMEAKKAYHKAMSDFKANPPKILKDKSVSFGVGKTSYTHASLANVCEKVSESLSKYGLSASWKVSQNGTVSVTCKVTHEKGHSEETSLSAPADTSGSKNAIQAIGSTITYLERYTLLALLGLATGDQDNDGGTIEFIDEKQLSVLMDSMKSKEVNEAKFLKYMGIESLEQMPKNKYKKAIEAIKAKGAK